MTKRIEQLQQWLTTELRFENFQITPASSDASFRRYFRVHVGTQTYIVMDAPTEQESCEPFIQVAKLLLNMGLNVPKVYSSNLDQGFLLLSDLGTKSYLNELNANVVDRLYGDAIGALVVIQACGPTDGLPPYDKALLLREMNLFRDWYLQTHLDIKLDKVDQLQLNTTFELLANSALSQPQVCVHRDYHSRNLMYCQHNPGILDFQDAVVGPVTYDLVSLLRDCYIEWSDTQVQEWAKGYHQLALQSGVFKNIDINRFLRWFDFMGIQRHLKAVGIFSRLNYRDKKPNYLKDIPRTLGYISQVSSRHPELAAFSAYVTKLVNHDGCKN